MKKYLLSIISLLCLGGLSVYLVGCSDNEDSASVESVAYSGPGSKWDVALNSDNTFVITYAATVGGSVDMTVNGTYESVGDGYLKLTVVSATGTDAPAAGEQAYALNIPGFVLLLKPMENDSEIIPMIASGSCPSSTLDFNWMVTSHENSGGGSSLATTIDLVGTASYDGSSSMSLPSRFALDGTSLGAGTSMAGTCSDGIISIPSSNADMWLSASGAALVQIRNGADDSVIVAMPQETISATADLDGEYFGIMFNDAIDESSESETQPVWMDITAGAGTAGSYTDVDAGTKSATEVNYSFTINQPANGFLNGTITEVGTGYSAPMDCQVTTDVNSSGKNIIFCVGIDPDSFQNGNADQLYTVMLISK